MKSQSKYEHLAFLIKNIWNASPFATIINLAQYVVNGASDSLIPLFLGMLINVVSSYNGVEKIQTEKRIVIYVSVLAILILTQILFEKFSQVIRENHIFSVQQHLDKVICKKLVDIPNDVLDTKEFQEDFQIVKETNNQIYLFITYFAEIISLIIQLLIFFVLLSKLSIVLIFPCIMITIGSIFAVTRVQLNYWSSYLSNTTLRRKMNYYLGLFMDMPTLSIIKAFRSDNYFLAKTTKVVDESVDAANKVIIKKNNRYAILQMCILILPIIIVILAVNAFFEDSIMVGDVIMYIGLGKNIHSSIMSLGTIIPKLQDINISVKKLYDFLFLERTNIAVNKTENVVPEHISDIEVNDLVFYYPNTDRPALDHISLRINSGNLIAIVGENGSGKSTFVKILLGLYKNYYGSIKINGIELRDLSQDVIIKLIAPCFQDFLKPKFFLREAVGFSNIECIGNDKKLEKTLISVNGDDILSDVGLDGQLGTEFYQGVSLSLGQWQKVAVARTYFGNKNITVLDEPMSAIDIYSEQQFLEVMNQNLNLHDLSIFVSHRMLGMKNCDEIFVFHDGKVIESGTHEQLIAKNGKYTELFHSQNVDV